jgi:protein TonB
MGTSLVLHLLIIFVMSIMMVAATEEAQVGFIEVEFGPFSEGRRIVQAPPQPVPPAPEPVVADPEEEQQPATAPPEEARPVDLPDQVEEVVDEEVITEPEVEQIAPEEQPVEEAVVEDVPQPEQETIQPLGSGALTDEVGEETGDEGVSNEPERSSPFQIEGLNRNPVDTPAPVYAEQVNAVIRVRIVVAPNGQIIQMIPLIKGNARLEEAVMAALRSWRFNPLPPNAPQENQTGQVTFRFTLR